jgi:Flp pilus assembly protein TadG
MGPKHSFRNRLNRFGRDRSGTAAIEFAFVAGPFLFMIFAVLELALVFLLSTSLEAATDKAARRIRTGQFQSANETKAQFKTAICGGMTWMAGNCSTNLTVHVTAHTRYNEVQPHDPTELDATGKRVLKTEQAALPAMPAETVVVVRAYYKWPLITPFMSQALQRLDGGMAIASSTQTFMTEPYQ